MARYLVLDWASSDMTRPFLPTTPSERASVDVGVSRRKPASPVMVVPTTSRNGMDGTMAQDTTLFQQVIAIL